MRAPKGRGARRRSSALAKTSGKLEAAAARRPRKWTEEDREERRAAHEVRVQKRAARAAARASAARCSSLPGATAGDGAAHPALRAAGSGEAQGGGGPGRRVVEDAGAAGELVCCAGPQVLPAAACCGNLLLASESAARFRAIRHSRPTSHRRPLAFAACQVSAWQCVGLLLFR